MVNRIEPTRRGYCCGALARCIFLAALGVCKTACVLGSPAGVGARPRPQAERAPRGVLARTLVDGKPVIQSLFKNTAEQSSNWVFLNKPGVGTPLGQRSETSSLIYVKGGDEFQLIPAIGVLLLDGSLHCSATVVGYKGHMALLTAGHCLAYAQVAKLKFAVGNDVNSISEEDIYSLVGWRVPSSFKFTLDKFVLENDIGVAFLDPEKPFSGQPLNLPAEVGNAASICNQELSVVGYGYASLNSGDTRRIGKKRAATLRVKAEGLHAGLFRWGNGDTATCQLDSGGPVILLNNQNPDNSLIVGITSFTDSQYCGAESTYVRVDHYLPWLRKVVLEAP